MSHDDDPDIEGIEIDSIDHIHGLSLNGHPLFTSVCYHHIRKVATQLDRLRHVSKRAAMKYLIDEMGFCETIAETIFTQLHMPMEVSQQERRRAN